MPNVPYIEYTDEDGIWVEIYFPKSNQYAKFGPYAPRLDTCPRCCSRDYVTANGTAICPKCRHMWDEPQPQPAPGTVAQIDIRTGQDDD